MPKFIEQWYHEGAPPIITIECNHCHRKYKILENQRFLCMCEQDEIYVTK